MVIEGHQWNLTPNRCAEVNPFIDGCAYFFPFRGWNVLNSLYRMVHMMDTDVAKSIQLSQFEVKCSFLFKWLNKFNQVSRFFFRLKPFLLSGPLIREMPRTLKKQKLIFRCYKALRRTSPDLVLNTRFSSMPSFLWFAPKFTKKASYGFLWLYKSFLWNIMGDEVYQIWAFSLGLSRRVGLPCYTTKK